MLRRFLALVLISVLFLPSMAQAETDTIYQRVMKTQTINCGYAEWPPFLSIDPNTKQVSGLMRDVWDLIGRKLDLRINWQSYTGWGEVTEAVKAGKVDVFCVGVWPDPGRTKNMLLSRPVFYNPTYLFGRADDDRFDNNYDALDKPSATVVGQEGDVTASILAVKFPHAKTANIPPMASQDDMIMNVTSKKGDVALLDVPYAGEYMKNNPGKLKRIKGPPIALMPTTLPLATGEYQLKSMIDVVLNDFINDGTISALIKKYNAQETYAPEPDVRVTKSEP